MAEEKPTKKPDKKPEEEVKAEKPAETPKEEKKANKPAEKKKSKKGLIFGIIFGLIAIVAVVLLVIFIPKGGDADDPSKALSYSTAFAIQDDGKYTLWNKDGNKVSEEEYDYISSFIAGYAYARKDNQVGIVRDNGSVSVEFGRYGELTQRGGLYLAKDGNIKKSFVLTGDGRQILEGDNISLRTSYSSSAYALAETPEKIYAFTHRAPTP